MDTITGCTSELPVKRRRKTRETADTRRCRRFTNGIPSTMRPHSSVRHTSSLAVICSRTRGADEPAELANVGVSSPLHELRMAFGGRTSSQRQPSDLNSGSAPGVQEQSNLNGQEPAQSATR